MIIIVSDESLLYIEDIFQINYKNIQLHFQFYNKFIRTRF